MAAAGTDDMASRSMSCPSSPYRAARHLAARSNSGLTWDDGSPETFPRWTKCRGRKRLRFRPEVFLSIRPSSWLRSYSPALELEEEADYFNVESF
jgi:hypothetical protein